MRIVLAPLGSLARRAVVSRECTEWVVFNAHSLSGIAHGCAEGAVDVVVLDPLDPEIADCTANDPAAAFAEISRIVACPIVVVTECSLSGLTVVAALARAGPFQLSCIRPDGGVDGLEAAVEAAASARTGVRTLHAIQPALGFGLDTRLSFVLGNLFASPVRYNIIERVSAMHGLAPESLNVRLRAAGLAPLHVMRRCARVACAHDLLVTYDLPMVTIAIRTGCGSVDSLARETRKAVGLPPARVAEELDQSSLIGLLVRIALPRHQPRAAREADGGAA